MGIKVVLEWEIHLMLFIYFIMYVVLP